MKNRKMTYALLLIVLAVWGGVAHRIFKMTSEDAPIAAQQNLRPRASQTVADTLLLNYRDPFLLPEPPPKPAALPVDPKPVPPPVTVKPPEERPLFKYKGSIHKGETSYAVVVRNGGIESFAPGETIDGYVLGSIFADSITVYKGKQYCTVKLE